MTHIANASHKRFLARFASMRKPPCFGCEHRQACATEELACGAFAIYTRTFGLSGNGPKTTHEIYLSIFTKQDEKL